MVRSAHAEYVQLPTVSVGVNVKRLRIDLACAVGAIAWGYALHAIVTLGLAERLMTYGHSCDDAHLATRLFILAGLAIMVASLALASWCGRAAGGPTDRRVAITLVFGLLWMLPYLYVVWQLLPAYDACD